jgi:hypothetical protein
MQEILELAAIPKVFEFGFTAFANVLVGCVEPENKKRYDEPMLKVKHRIRSTG